MARRPRITPGGLPYHVLNRSAGKFKMLRKDPDFEAFERIMAEAVERHPIRILAWCILSTHWHFVVWPTGDDEVTNFFRWLTHTHAMRWRVSRRTVGYGHLYQGRFKSFPIQSDDHCLTVCRYVERNALSAGLVKRAEDWRWGSLWARTHESSAQHALLTNGPVPLPSDWVKHVNAPITKKERLLFEESLHRGRPLGSEAWVAKTVKKLGLEHTIRSEGRPKKDRNGDAASFGN